MALDKDNNMHAELNRRKEDSLAASQKIDEMILDVECAPRERAQLMVQRAMCDCLVTCLEKITTVGNNADLMNTKVITHMEEEDKRVAAEDGRWSVMEKVLTTGQILLMAVAGWTVRDVSGIHDLGSKHDTSIQLLDLQVKQLTAAQLVINAAPLQSKVQTETKAVTK
jgi:hypothetical protein